MVSMISFVSQGALLLFFVLLWSASDGFSLSVGGRVSVSSSSSGAPSCKAHQPDETATTTTLVPFLAGREEKLGLEEEDQARASRRHLILRLFSMATTAAAATPQCVHATSSLATTTTLPPNFHVVSDPETYPGVVHIPTATNPARQKLLPVVVVLHGAGTNQADVTSLWDRKGEHGGLAPSLLAAGTAPIVLRDEVCLVAPYAAGMPSFYDEPRSKVLQWITWLQGPKGRAALGPQSHDCVDWNSQVLFGFSDGATVALELATTGRFRAVGLAACGFAGRQLPALALQRLATVPFWIFHSADDVLLPVRNADRLVDQLRGVGDPARIRYTRFDQDPLGLTGSAAQGHVSVGVVASQTPSLYEWFLSSLQV